MSEFEIDKILQDAGFEVLPISADKVDEIFQHTCEVCGELRTLQNFAEHDAKHAAEEGRIPIREEDKVHEQWYEEAKAMTMDKLPEFLDRLINKYHHDYGTICHALSAGALATAWALERSPAGGITGFQSGFVMWGFVIHWMGLEGKPVRLFDYSKLLYPQFESEFKTITKDTWSYAQREAKRLLENESLANERVIAHWQSIVSGKIPFGLSLRDG